MFLHIGAEIVIPMTDIISIVNLDNSLSKITKEFIHGKQKQERVIYISESNQKSLVVTKDCLYITPISTNTLKKRARFGVL